MLIEKVLDAKQSRIRLSACHSNRASEIGHPCERYLVLRRTRWQEFAVHDLRLQLIFDEGHLHEEAVLDALRRAGWQLIDQQRDYDDKPTQITGHLDAKVVLNGQAYPIEVKSMSAFGFEKIQTWQDFLHGDWWMQKYPAQLQLYLYLSNSERGYLIVKNKQTGELKEFEMVLDYPYVETLLKKAERVNAHVNAGTIPDPIPYEERICGSCPAFDICLPAFKSSLEELQTNPELEKKLARRDELAPLAKEYETVDKAVKTQLKEHDNVLIGDWLIKGQWIEKTVPAQPEKQQRYWLTKIQRLVKEGTHGE